MKKAIYGGSFDPVHLGHVEVVKKAKDYCDKIIVMPNYINPLKKRVFAPAKKRVEWLKRVFKDMDYVEVSDFEISKNRPVYSIETIEHFKPDYFIIGSDNLKTLDKWRDIDKILQKVEFIVAKRGEIDKELLKKYNIKKIIDMDVPISSSEIRAGNFNFLPKEIEKDIKEFYESRKD